MNTSSIASRIVTRLPLAALLIALFRAIAAAQEPVTSFSRLSSRVGVGDTVRVTDSQGQQVSGRILELHDASMTLDSQGTRTVAGDRVSRVDLSAKRVGHAALMGLLIGGAAGAVLVVATQGECVSDCTGGGWAIGFGIGAGIGAGVGAAVRAARPASWKEVYRAPGTSGYARLSLSPAITPRTKGVAVSYSF